MSDCYAFAPMASGCADSSSFCVWRREFSRRFEYFARAFRSSAPITVELRDERVKRRRIQGRFSFLRRREFVDREVHEWIGSAPASPAAQSLEALHRVAKAFQPIPVVECLSIRQLYELGAHDEMSLGHGRFPRQMFAVCIESPTVGLVQDVPERSPSSREAGRLAASGIDPSRSIQSCASSTRAPPTSARQPDFRGPCQQSGSRARRQIAAAICLSERPGRKTGRPVAPLRALLPGRPISSPAQRRLPAGDVLRP